MKRLITLLLLTALMLTVSACSKQSQGTDPEYSDEPLSTSEEEDNKDDEDDDDDGEDEGDRESFVKLHDLFLNTQAFVHVRVVEVERFTETVLSRDAQFQHSTVELISLVWDNGELENELPQTFTVKQRVRQIYRNVEADGQLTDMIENGLIKGEEYVLPLVYINNWFVQGDEDVLFQIDSDGKVNPNSWREGFRIFSGKDVSELKDAIVDLAMSKDYDLARSDFGTSAYWYQLAEVSVESIKETANDLGTELLEYTIRIDKVHTTTSYFQPVQNYEVGETLKMRWTKSSKLKLEKTGRYLMFVSSPLLPVSIWWYDCAIIDNNGKITPVPNSDNSSSGLNEYSGYSVEQVVELAEKAKAWHEKYTP